MRGATLETCLAKMLYCSGRIVRPHLLCELFVCVCVFVGEGEGKGVGVYGCVGVGAGRRRGKRGVERGRLGDFPTTCKFEQTPSFCPSPPSPSPQLTPRLWA